MSKELEVETLGQRVFRLRENAGLSQRELATKPGCTYAYISRIEAGTRDPSMKALRLLAPRLGVSVHYLEYGFEDPLRERCRTLVEIAKTWRSRTIVALLTVEQLQEEGRETPDPTDLRDTLVAELRKLNERADNGETVTVGSPRH